MATTSANKVKFGLSNAHYAVYDDETGKYGTPVPIKGSVNLTMDPEGDSSKFYADNVAYYATNKNSGYSGSLEIAFVEKQLQIDLLGFVDDGGLLLEMTDAQPKSFALLFEIDGNVNKQRCVFYNCTLARPTNEASTTEDTVEPQTSTLDITAIGRDLDFKGESKNVVKGVIDNSAENKTKYDGFYTAVLLPTKEA